MRKIKRQFIKFLKKHGASSEIIELIKSGKFTPFMVRVEEGKIIRGFMLETEDTCYVVLE